jgi:hypothetical protein
MFDIFYLDKKPNLFAHEQQVTSIEQAQSLSRTRFFWVVNYLCDYTGFDFLWEPVPWEAHQRHVWASQWQTDSGTCLVPKQGYTDTNYHKDQVHRLLGTPVVAIDHINGVDLKIDNTVKTVRYFDNYRDTLIRIAKNLQSTHEHVWICSSICDYSDFDFSWHPDPWQTQLLHVFASDDQKFGDTFYMHVPTFAEHAEKKALLDWYDVNYASDILVPRRPIPIVKHTSDSHVDVVKTHIWTAPLTLFTVDDTLPTVATVSLWRDTTKTIVPLTEGATSVIVPQLATPYIKTQLYDYPYIDKTFKKISNSQMDVIFISYDEPDADKNWKLLKNRVTRAVRVHGIKGMELALEAAADTSTTPWYYAVFAKTELHENFDFSFVPDFMQQPKNYIFDCLNTVNQLQYGHMGIVMYNCQGVKQLNREKNFGLDYTLSFPHESIPILSCYGKFDQSPYHTWRTAFRETAKLSYFESVSESVDGEYRLQVWQNKATGPYSNWCIQGARDGVEFFKTVGQNLMLLKQSFDWVWLRDYFVSKYGERE